LSTGIGPTPQIAKYVRKEKNIKKPPAINVTLKLNVPAINIDEKAPVAYPVAPVKVKSDER
jgi:hypothetical protein